MHAFGDLSRVERAHSSWVWKNAESFARSFVTDVQEVYSSSVTMIFVSSHAFCEKYTQASIWKHCSCFVKSAQHLDNHAPSSILSKTVWIHHSLKTERTTGSWMQTAGGWMCALMALPSQTRPVRSRGLRRLPALSPARPAIDWRLA